MCDYGPEPFLFSITDKVPFAFGAEIEMNPHKFLHHFLAVVKRAAVFSLIYNMGFFLSYNCSTGVLCWFSYNSTSALSMFGKFSSCSICRWHMLIFLLVFVVFFFLGGAVWAMSVSSQRKGESASLNIFMDKHK